MSPTTAGSYSNSSYYYCYDCGYYIPSGYYCAHSYYGTSYANSTYANTARSSNEVVVVNRRHRSNRSPRRTTRYTVTTTRYYV